MAWNGSENKQAGDAANAPKSVRTTPPSKWRGLIALVIVAAGALCAWWFMRPAGEAQSEKNVAHSTMIAEVAPQIVTNESAAAGAVRLAKRMEKQRTGEVRNGMLMLSNGKLIPEGKLRRARKEERFVNAKYAIFDHPTDNELAVLLTLEPGKSLIGGPMRKGVGFEEKFLKSLETPIVVSKDDPEDVQDVKRAVMQSRLELKAAYDRGEDLRQIVADAYVDAQKLAMYKKDVEQEIKRVAKEADLTDSEVDDVIAAANAMLESKGIAPMKLGPVARARLKTLKTKSKKENDQ